MISYLIYHSYKIIRAKYKNKIAFCQAKFHFTTQFVGRNAFANSAIVGQIANLSYNLPINKS